MLAGDETWDDWRPSIQAVWWDQTSAIVYLGAEQAITPEFLTTEHIEVVLTVNTQSWLYNTEAGGALRAQHANIEWLHLPFLDDIVANQSRQHGLNAAAAIHYLMSTIERGQLVLVHCHAGMHRSPAVVYNALYLLGRVENAFTAYGIIRRHRRDAGWRKGLVKWSRGKVYEHYPHLRSDTKSADEAPSSSGGAASAGV